MKKDEYDIVIIGAGLVGSAVAAAIVGEPINQHLSIALVDQASEPKQVDLSIQPPEFDARVVALTHASVNFLKRLDVWESILRQRACPYRYMKVWDDEGTGSICFDVDELDQSELGFIVENRIVLNAVLKKLSDYEQIDVIRGCGLESLTTKSNGQKLVLSNGSELSAKLIVAADGGQSKIRELVGFETRSWSYQHKAIVATVKTEKTHQFTAWQNFLVTGPLAFLPLQDQSEKYSSIVWSVENEKANELMALPDDDFLKILGEAFEYKLGKVETVSKRFCFPLVQRHAVTYIDSQLVLVGDAAHTIHPLAGQGVNLGLLDAKALSDELTRASLRKLSLDDASILRRYERKCKKHNLEVMLMMESFKRLFGNRSLTLRWLRNNGLKTIDKLKPIKNWMAKQAMGL